MKKTIGIALVLMMTLASYGFGKGIAETTDFEMNGTELVKYKGNAENIIIPAGVTVIGASTFRGNNSIVSVTIPMGVTVIGESAFSNCYSLTSINIPASVTSIGDRAFSGCSNLKTVTVSRKTKRGMYDFPDGARVTYSD